MCLVGRWTCNTLVETLHCIYHTQYMGYNLNTRSDDEINHPSKSRNPNIGSDFPLNSEL